MADDGHDLDPGRQRLVVALVRGVHGLHGAVRVEVLTDRPESAVRRRAPCSIREGDGRAADDRLGRGRRGRARLARPLPRGRRRARAPTRCARPTSRRRSGRRPTSRRGEVYWHEVIGMPVRGARRHRARRRPGHLPGRRERGLRGRRRAVRRRSTCRRSGRSSGSSRRVAARSSIDAEALDLQPPKVRPTGDGSTAGAAADVAQARGDRRGRRGCRRRPGAPTPATPAATDDPRPTS